MDDSDDSNELYKQTYILTYTITPQKRRSVNANPGVLWQWWRRGLHGGGVVVPISIVTLRRAHLVPGSVTIIGQVNRLSM